MLKPTMVALGAVATFLTLSLPGSTAQESARALYANTGCATCHGPEGLGTAAGPSVATGALSLSEFIAYVRKPKGAMRAYGRDVVSDADLTEIYAFLEPENVRGAPPGRLEVGAELYRRTGCYECHSNEAQGGAQGPRLGPNPVTFAMFSWYVRHPRGSMPPYTETVLSDRDLADIYAFVEARPEPPSLSSIPLLASPR